MTTVSQLRSWALNEGSRGVPAAAAAAAAAANDDAIEGPLGGVEEAKGFWNVNTAIAGVATDACACALAVQAALTAAADGGQGRHASPLLLSSPPASAAAGAES
jgi:hypothetical protein